MGFNIENYTLIKDRLREFRQENKGCTITTELLRYESVHDTSNNESCNECVFKATVIPNPLECPEIYFVGHAAERDNTGFVNKSSAIENCETSAVGRALAYAGYGGDDQFASAEEVVNAKIHQAKSHVTVDLLEILNNAFTVAKPHLSKKEIQIYTERRSNGYYDTKTKWKKSVDHFKGLAKPKLEVPVPKTKTVKKNSEEESEKAYEKQLEDNLKHGGSLR